MDDPADEVLSDAAFPMHQDRRIRVGDVLDECSDRSHLRASVQEGYVVGRMTLSTINLCQRPVR